MRFYTTASNSRKKEVGIGGGAKGQYVHTRGWSVGVKVISTPDSEYDGDRFDIYMTGGSNEPSAKKKIGMIRNGEFIACGE